MDFFQNTPSIVIIVISWLIIIAFMVVIFRKFRWRKSKSNESLNTQKIHATVTNKYMTDNYRYSRSAAPSKECKSMVEFTYDDKSVHTFDLPLYYDAFELKDSGMLILKNGDFCEFILDK